MLDHSPTRRTGARAAHGGGSDGPGRGAILTATEAFLGGEDRVGVGHHDGEVDWVGVCVVVGGRRDAQGMMALKQ